ncbi:MAG: hypothetical protein NTW28_26650 [Candidatus Solibacter sp.]|nr:hypothetical protein [Candidatus Solibacter sp.]
MIPSHRQRFNRDYSEARYARFLALLQRRCGEPVPFRHSETPCFLPGSLVDTLARYGREMVEQLLANPRYERESRAAIPPQYNVPGEDAVPMFVQADFGLDAELRPQLVEIQGFPTLYAYQPLLAESYRAAYGLDESLHALPDGLEAQEYGALLRRAIVGRHDPENVVLLEIDPTHQKTRHDFLMTEQEYGVRAVDISSVVKQGNGLFYRREGRLTPIRRIYNRAIVDELVRKQIPMAFDFRDELDVEWAGHPNWFFRLSKFSLPYLDHPAVPRTRFLDRAQDIERPEDYVLKPLYSFAGAGVIVGPTADQLAAVPAAQRSQYILQERVDFRPVVDTPFGPTKMEIRIMYIWLGRLRAVNTIIRMGRGAQMGVDHNKGFAWVGASAGFIDRTQ